ncbi:MAG: metalloregulator ArsR/SmtB family transcription factor [Mariprofundaceae bacterium]|nr:metalloregulator ArsR/SmtB family transcription factor [Mariprofundaceae bacterium]
MIQGLSASFKALGDPVRLRLFALLGHSKELCVCHLVDALQLPQSTVSRHLSILRHAGLLETRREGKWMYYHLCGDLSTELFTVLQKEGCSQIEQDLKALHCILAP